MGSQMCNYKVMVAVFMFASVFSFRAEAKLYKWVDNSGNTHYGEAIPPEYGSKEKESHNQPAKAGKQVVIMSPEMIRAMENKEAKKVAANKELEEKKRRDHALMNTYTSEKEIDQARDRSLALINARIDSNSILLNSSQRTVLELKKEAATRTSEGKKIPQSLTDDLNLAEEKMVRYQLEIRKSEEEFASVTLRFENDKTQYRKIIIVKPGSNPEKNDYSEYNDTVNSADYQDNSRRSKRPKSRPSY